MKVGKRIGLLLCAALLLIQVPSAAFVSAAEPETGAAQVLNADAEDTAVTAQALGDIDIAAIMGIIDALAEKVSDGKIKSEIKSGIAEVRQKIEKAKAVTLSHISEIIGIIQKIGNTTLLDQGSKIKTVVSEVMDVLTLIGKISDMKAISSIRNRIKTAKKAVDELNGELKAELQEKVSALLARVEKCLEVAELIMALPEKNITLAVKEKVEAAKAAFDGLSTMIKGMIDSKVQEKLEKIEAVMNAVELIEKLPDKITTDDKAAVTDAKAAVDALPQEQKDAIGKDVLQKLEDAVKTLDQTESAALKEMEKQIDSLTNDLLSAKETMAKQNQETDAALKDLTDQITALRGELLSATRQNEVNDAALKELTDAIAALKTKMETYEANHAYSVRPEDVLCKSLLLTTKGSTATAEWGLVSGADRYEVYADYTGGNEFEKVAVATAFSSRASFGVLHGQELNRKKNLQVYVVAFRNNQAVARSIMMYGAGSAVKKYSNAKKVTTDQKAYSIKAGRSKKISAKAVCPNGKKQIKGQCRSFRYVSLNPSIASVSANGKVKGLTPGNCIVRVYAKNGCSRDVKVVVK